MSIVKPKILTDPTSLSRKRTSHLSPDELATITKEFLANLEVYKFEYSIEAFHKELLSANPSPSTLEELLNGTFKMYVEEPDKARPTKEDPNPLGLDWVLESDYLEDRVRKEYNNIRLIEAAKISKIEKVESIGELCIGSPAIVKEPCLHPRYKGFPAFLLACTNIHRLGDSSILRRLLDLYPDVVKQPLAQDFYPLHKAITAEYTDRFITASQQKKLPFNFEGVKFVADAFPEAIKSKTFDGKVAIHIAFSSFLYTDKALIVFLIEKHPEGLETKDKKGLLPIHKLASKSTKYQNCHLFDYGNMKTTRTFAHESPSYNEVSRNYKDMRKRDLVINPNNAANYSDANNRSLEPYREFQAATLKIGPGFIPYDANSILSETLTLAPLSLSPSPLGISIDIDAAGNIEGGVEAEIMEQLLVLHPQHASVPDNKGWCPLHHACAQQRPNIQIIYTLAESAPGVLFTKTTDEGDSRPLDLLRRIKERDHTMEELIGHMMDLYKEEFGGKKGKGSRSSISTSRSKKGGGGGGRFGHGHNSPSRGGSSRSSASSVNSGSSGSGRSSPSGSSTIRSGGGSIGSSKSSRK